MADLATLNVRVEAREAIRQADNLSRSLKSTGVAGEQATQSHKRTEAQLRRLQLAELSARQEAERMAAAQSASAKASQLQAAAMRVATVAMAAYAASRAVGVFTDMADSAKLLEGRLKLVTGSAAELDRIQSALVESAKRTRTSYEANVTLYSRVARATEDLNKSQAELLQFAELTQMAIKAGGASATEARAGVIQFTQAIAGGIVRAEELNSLLEQTPGLAQAIAAGLGVSQGALRKLVIEGNLTSEMLFGAIEKVEAKIRGDFAQMPALAAEGWQSLRDEIMLTVGAMNEATGTTSKFFDLMSGTALILQSLREGRGGGPLEFIPGLGGVLFGTRSGPDAAAPANAHGAASAGALAALDAVAAADRKAAEAANALRLAEEAATAARRDAWEKARTFAAEKKRWDDAEVVRLHDIATAAHAANVARIGGSLTMGAGSTTVARGTIGSPAMLPAGFGADSSLIAPQARDGVERARMEEAERVNELIARNFLENMQRAVGDIAAEFLRSGQVSVQSLAGLLADAGAQSLAQKASGWLAGKMGGMPPGLDVAATVIGGVVEAFIGSAQQFRREMEAARLAMQDWNRSLTDWIEDARAASLTPEERARLGIARRGEQFARDAFEIYRNAPGDFQQGLTGDPMADRATLERQLAAVGGNWQRLWGIGETPVSALQAYFEALGRVTEGTQAHTQALEEQTRANERAAALQRIESLDRTIEGLSGFQTSLGMSNLSTLNPFQQLDLAKTEYNRILQRAMSGDQDAAGQLPAAARAFLEQSRGVNASGARYASDFDRVNADTERALALFEGRRTNEQEQLDVQTGTLEATRAVGTTLVEQNEILKKGMAMLIEETRESRRALTDEVAHFRREMQLAA